uniref:Uncharacterized protein n=1 Tax=uncultured Chloroflexi bacterium HF0200_09I09 TaxID=710736 RepID=E0XU71_9CHLR|nr:hypothetical protein [uncultured Chloroflexi bacterium HF0200_09I09]
MSSSLKPFSSYYSYAFSLMWSQKHSWRAKHAEILVLRLKLNRYRLLKVFRNW